MSDSESDESHLIDNTTSLNQLERDDGAIVNYSQPSVPDIIASNVGMLFIISAQFFSACMYISVKILNRLETPVHALQVIIIRMAVTFLCCVTYMIIMRIPDPITGPKDVRSLLITRGITGFFGLSGVYLSLEHLSVADATVLIFLTPLTTAVAGSILLKESYSTNQAVAGACSLLGVVLVTRPPFLFGSIPNGGHLPEGTPAERLAAVGACMMSVLGNTGAYTSIRAIGKRAHPMHVLTFFSLWCTIISSLGMIVLNIPVVYPTPWGWMLLFMVGVFGFVTQTLLTMGLQRETVSRGVTGMYTQVIFAVMLERLIFGVMPSLLSIVGAVIIMSSALYVVVSGHGPRFCCQSSVLIYIGPTR
ncbi:drug/metabolite transporter superfamily [Suillus subaureus]|uniref:Drug/metabolite transporter superfamily n=1 Tax=Suillus subaureus TaxID=48587 RepID=A0A9P7DXE4_9AGAM|nr:drug/metabolite transporter superfamily [Suillus subaureus]KAG1805221.1 drug/metabolite transporter superfamily [Suillus subaureus]